MIIYLYGAPGSGKTTLGRKLAGLIGANFTDLDERISAADGKSIAEIFEQYGEAEFRSMESAALRSVESEAEQDGLRKIVALGGGTLLDDANRAFCEQTGIIFCIDTPSEEELERRLARSAGSRPLGNRAKERKEHYESFPNRISSIYEVGGSLIVVGSGIAPMMISGMPCAVDENVVKLYKTKLPAPIAVVQSGEEHKTPPAVAELWSAFYKAGLGRGDMVVSVGGGVTGDLVGFAAATFMRGIDWINVPTTLLAMVDASIGGKTGCDLPEGKNLAGTYHYPKLVIIDTDFLKTLPDENRCGGRAEMVKHEIIGGKGRMEIAENLGIKVEIVREDPKERIGRRILLNCGHTVAHAVEKLSEYHVSHGQAVAIGCVAEARIAVELKLADPMWPDELAKAFAAEGLETEFPKAIDSQAAIEVMKGDKKRSGTGVSFALPCGWGNVRITRLDLAGAGGKTVAMALSRGIVKPQKI